MERPSNVEFSGYLSSELKTHGLLRAVHERIRAIALTDISQVVHRDPATGQPIVPVEPTVARIINVYRILRRCALDVLAPQELAAILETSLRINAIFDALKTFDPLVATTLDASGAVSDVAAQTESVSAAAFENLGIIIAKTFCLGDFFISQVDGAGEHFSRIMSLSLEARATLTDIQRIARFEVSSKFEETFDREAAAHGRARLAWTIGTICFALGGLADLTITFQKLASQLAVTGIAKLIVVDLTQVTAAAFIFFLMVFCAKNAFAHRESQIASIHRRNILRTAIAIAEAATSETIRTNILTQAAATVFGIQISQPNSP